MQQAILQRAFLILKTLVPLPEGTALYLCSSAPYLHIRTPQGTTASLSPAQEPNVLRMRSTNRLILCNTLALSAFMGTLLNPTENTNQTPPTTRWATRKILDDGCPIPIGYSEVSPHVYLCFATSEPPCTYKVAFNPSKGTFIPYVLRKQSLHRLHNPNVTPSTNRQDVIHDIEHFIVQSFLQNNPSHPVTLDIANRLFIKTTSPS